MDRKIKTHVLFMLLILVLTLSMNFWQTTNRIRTLGDVGMHHFLFHYNRETVLKYHEFPLWFDNMFSGFPFFANTQADTLLVYALPFMFTLPTKTALNVTMLLGVFLSALFMYILMLNMKLEPKYALISAMVWALSTSNMRYVGSWVGRYKVLAFIPLTFLFFYKAYHSKDWFKYSILAGVSLALQFHGGGVDFFIFSLVIFALYFAGILIGKNFKQRIMKLGLIVIVASLLFFGLIAIKLFPMLEFAEISSKQTGFDYEDSVGTVARGKYFWQLHYKEVGIVALLLGLVALSGIKKKKIFLAFLVLFAGYLIITGSPFYYLLWKYVPGFSATHHVVRASFVIMFGLAILAGYGAKEVLSRCKDKKKIVFAIILLLLIADMSYNFYQYRIRSPTKYDSYWGPDYEEMIEGNELLQYVSKQTGLFRVENIRASGHSGLTMVYMVPLNLTRLYGATSLWIPEYFNVYLSVAYRSQPKFWGMLNAKYVYSKEAVNVSGYKFIKKFNECEFCIEDEIQDQGVSGPYLYENELFLPRAYMADNSILVIGNKENVDQITYSLMLEQSFDPSNTVIVMEYGKIDDYEFLKRFDAVILTQGSVDQNSGFILQQYVNNGGILMPNIVEGNNQITQEDISSLLSGFKGNYNNVKEISFSLYTPNKRYIELDGKSGWLVLSEKFHMFEGWEPEINGDKKKNHRANGINTAVYLEGGVGEMKFEYNPKSFRRGLTISLITLLLIIVYFIVYYVRKKS